jgi:hypothetical protein
MSTILTKIVNPYIPIQHQVSLGISRCANLGGWSHLVLCAHVYVGKRRADSLFLFVEFSMYPRKENSPVL